MSFDVTIDAPAKVNLCLDILGKRPDGFHEIDTVMLTVSLCDSLGITDRRDGELHLSVNGRAGGVPADERNLVFKAARRIQELAPSRGADIHLHKRIPTGAGLGGGSSDAASALLGLCQVWGLAVPEKDLMEIAADLGSDVAFFLRGGLARCRGRGERVEWLDARGALDLVLVFSEPLSTADVYNEYNRQKNESSTSSSRCDTLFNAENGGLDLEQIRAKRLPNALTPAAIGVRAGLSDVGQAIADAGVGNVSMSGSGSCFFGIADSKTDADRVVGRLLDAGLEAVQVRSLGPRAPGDSGMPASKTG